MKTLFALAAASAVAVTTAQLLSPSFISLPSSSAGKVKRATFAIDSILARSEPICTSDSISSLCAQQSQALSSIAGSALAGYSSVLVREASGLDRRAPPGKIGEVKHPKFGKHSQWHQATQGFVGVPGADTAVKRRDDDDFYEEWVGFVGPSGGDTGVNGRDVGDEDEDEDDVDVDGDGEDVDEDEDDMDLEKRAPPGKIGEAKHQKFGKHSQWHKATQGFVGEPGADTAVKAKRAPPGKIGEVKHPKFGKHSQWHKATQGFVGEPGADTAVKAKRAPPGKIGEVKHPKFGKHSQWHQATQGFVGEPGSDTAVKAKRDALPEAIIEHCINDASLCDTEDRMLGEGYLLSKRDAEDDDVAETMQPRGVGETLIAIRDAVDVIKREAEDAGEDADDEVEGYFADIDEKVRRAVELLED